MEKLSLRTLIFLRQALFLLRWGDCSVYNIVKYQEESSDPLASVRSLTEQSDIFLFNMEGALFSQISRILDTIPQPVLLPSSHLQLLQVIWETMSSNAHNSMVAFIDCSRKSSTMLSLPDKAWRLWSSKASHKGGSKRSYLIWLISQKRLTLRLK